MAASASLPPASITVFSINARGQRGTRPIVKMDTKKSREYARLNIDNDEFYADVVLIQEETAPNKLFLAPPLPYLGGVDKLHTGIWTHLKPIKMVTTQYSGKKSLLAVVSWNNREILLGSIHGPKKISKKEREQFFISFFSQILQQEYPVILGGDWNCSLQFIQSILQNEGFEHFRVHKPVGYYSQGQEVSWSDYHEDYKRKKLLEFWVHCTCFVPPNESSHSHCSGMELNFVQKESLEPVTAQLGPIVCETTPETIKQILDHPPIWCQFTPDPLIQHPSSSFSSPASSSFPPSSTEIDELILPTEKPLDPLRLLTPQTTPPILRGETDRLPPPHPIQPEPFSPPPPPPPVDESTRED